MKWFFAVVVSVVLLLLLAIALAPAHLIVLALQEVEARGLLPASAPRLTLGQTSGSIWWGEAADSQLLIDGVTVTLGTVSWKLNPMSLLNRAPSVHLAMQAPDLQLQLQITATEQAEVTLQNVEGRFPMSLFEPWVPMLVKGDIAFVVDHAVFNTRQILALDGVLNLEYVDWLGGDSDMALGSYMAQMYLTEKSEVMIQINDFGASLGIDGSILISPTGSYHFNALLFPRSDLAPEVAQAIRWVGRPDNEGNITVNKRGEL